MLEIFFSLLFILVSYFMTTLAIVQGLAPGATTVIQDRSGKVQKVAQYGKIMLVSFVIAGFFSGIMFYLFIYPNYYPSL